MLTYAYERRRPENTLLYEVIRDNAETLYAACDTEGTPLPDFVKREVEGYLVCGLLCRGFATMQCTACKERRLVAFSCKGRGFCPSCTGRRRAQTAANLTDYVLADDVDLRQWVLTLPSALRARLAYNSALLSRVCAVFADTVMRFYAKRMQSEIAQSGQSGAITVVQRTSSDLRLNPHIHLVALDGVYALDGDEPAFHKLTQVTTHEVVDVLSRAVTRIEKLLTLKSTVDVSSVAADDAASNQPLLSAIGASIPPAGPTVAQGAAPSKPRTGATGLRIRAPRSVELDGYSLHAATRAGANDPRAKEALLRYVLRPPIAQERITHGDDGLVRIVLKKPFPDGTFAIDIDPLSLLLRLAAAVPAPRFHTVRYSGCLGPASKLRPLIIKATPEPITPDHAVLRRQRRRRRR